MATQKKYICAFCARAFTRSEHKQRHERSHTNEKPFHCNRCTSSFVRRDLLQRHSRTVHNVNDVSDMKREPKNLVDSPLDSAHENIHRDTISNHSDPSINSSTLIEHSFSNYTNKSSHPEYNPPSPSDSLVLRKKKSNSTSTDNHDLIHLLLITRKLDLVLSSLANNDSFLIGYTHLINHPGPYIVFDKILADLVSYLNQFNFNKDTINPVKLGIIYSVISLGNCMNLNFDECLQFFIQGWNLLIKELIPNYNNNNNLLDQIEILNNLFVLSFIYLNYNLLKYCDSSISEFLNDDIILNYLNDISFIIYNNLLGDEIMVNLNLPLFWNTYLLLSNYLLVPPKLYLGLKLRKLDDRFNANNGTANYTTQSNNNTDINYNFNNHNQLETGSARDESNNQTTNPESDGSLQLILKNSAKTCISSDVSDFYKNIVIATLENELKAYTNGEEFLIFSSRNCLHNSVILINKSFNVDASDSLSSNLPTVNSSDPASVPRRSSTGSVNFNSLALAPSLKLFALFKKNLIINSPLKFHELVQNYVFIPTNMYNWELLSITSQEINIYYPINQLLRRNLVAINGNLQVGLFNFFNYKQNNIDINNNLAIVSFPLIFLSPYLNLKFLDLTSYNDYELEKVIVIIFEWYLIMIKILLIIWNQNKLFEENYILQSLIYLLLDNKSPLMKLIEKQENTENGEEEKFEFNQKWFMILKLKFDSILESWIDFLKSTRKNNPQVQNSINILHMNINQFVESIINNEFNKFNHSFEHNTAHPSNSVLNYTNSFVPPLIDNQRRANSITLGILQHNGILDSSSNAVVTPLTTPNTNSSYFRQSSSQTFNDPRFTNFSAFAPPTQLKSLNAMHDLHLPPILPKGEDHDEKVLKPLIPNVQRGT